VPYSDPEVRREDQRRRYAAHRDELVERRKVVDPRKLAVLRALLVSARGRYNHNQCEPFRREVDRLQNAIDELIAGPELERMRSTPHPDPLLASHAPEVPAGERVGRPIWSVMRELYWTKKRRAMYGRAM
jgi:hypothetical protein